MQEKKSLIIDEKLLEKVISVAYGDAGWLEKFVVNRKAKGNPEIEAMLDQYRTTAGSVHRLKDEDLADSIVNSVFERTSKSYHKNSFGSFIYSRFFARPILSAGTIGIVVLIVFALLFFQPKEEIRYTKDEIELAQKQLQESISIVNKVFRKAGHQLDTNVLPNHVDKHLNKGLYIINDYLIGG